VTRIRPKAVIFDYCNVLSAPQGAGEIDGMSSILSVPRDQFLPAYWEFRVAYDEAALDPEEYWNLVAQRLSRSLRKADIVKIVDIDSRSWAHPAPALPQWARELRNAGLKTALLSNMPAPVRDHILVCDWLPQFDQRVFSCEVRAAKPAAEIFNRCLDGLKVNPPEILFLDDRPENVQAAQRLGLQSIVYSSLEQAARELARFDLPVPLGGPEFLVR
jgi:putative hydrolase of the HAD superfamily